MVSKTSLIREGLSVLLNSKLNDDFLNKLKVVINDSTIESLDQIFGYKIETSRACEKYDNSIVAFVTFWEGIETLKFCFVFQNAFLQELLNQIYPEGSVTKDTFEELGKDTACEIVNIICNKIKAFLNKNGFYSIMNLPYAEVQNAAVNSLSNDVAINANFSAGLSNESSNSVMYVNFSVE